MKDLTEGFLLETIIHEMRETGQTTLLNCVVDRISAEENRNYVSKNDNWETRITIDSRDRKDFYFVTYKNDVFSGNGGIINWKNKWSTHT